MIVFSKDFHKQILRAYQWTKSLSLCETAKKRMNIDDSRVPSHVLHNFRITRLWTACTRLIRKHLNPHKFH